MAIVWLEGLSKLKKKLTSSGLESATFRLAAIFEYKKHGKVNIFYDILQKRGCVTYNFLLFLVLGREVSLCRKLCGKRGGGESEKTLHNKFQPEKLKTWAHKRIREWVSGKYAVKLFCSFTRRTELIKKSNNEDLRDSQSLVLWTSSIVRNSK
jgi:hypothetical protein